MLDSLKKVEIKELVEFKVLEIFPSVDHKGQYITLRATFLDSQKTLSRDRVKACEEAVVSALEKKGFPLKP